MRAEAGLRSVRERILRVNVSMCGAVWLYLVSCRNAEVDNGLRGFVTYCHSIPASSEGKTCGLLDRYEFMFPSASTALPSTTSSTAKPSTFAPHLPRLATSVTTAPPRLWPTRTKGGNVFHSSCSLSNSTADSRSEARVERDMSCAELSCAVAKEVEVGLKCEP